MNVERKLLDPNDLLKGYKSGHLVDFVLIYYPLINRCLLLNVSQLEKVFLGPMMSQTNT